MDLKLTTMKTLDYNAIQKEIHDNYLDLKSGIYDVYKFCGYISEKYFKKADPKHGNRIDEDPYADLIFAMLTINDIELY